MKRATVPHVAEVIGRFLVANALILAVFEMALTFTLRFSEAQHAPAGSSVDNLVGNLRYGFLITSVVGGILSGVVFSFKASPKTRRHCLWLFVSASVVITTVTLVVTSERDGWSLVSTALLLLIAALFPRRKPTSIPA